MAYGYGGWAPYVPVAERRRMAEREMAKLRKKGYPVSPVRIEGRTIAGTFWGKSWCQNLESYRDYENRLPRGRTYVRNGSVVDLQIDAGGRIATHLIGPRNPKTRGNMQLDITIEPRPASRTIVIRGGDAQPRELEVIEGKWSDWLKVKFKTGMFQSVRGMVRFFLVRQEPAFELYASPVNIYAQSPLFPNRHPP